LRKHDNSGESNNDRDCYCFSDGKFSLKEYFKMFNTGDKVVLKAEPSIHKGMYHPRFLGKMGVIKGKKGSCYEVAIKDIGKEKTLIVHPIHLRRL